MVVKQLNKLGQDIFMNRYAYPGDRNWSDRAKTIAKHIASAEKSEDVNKWEKRFFDSIASLDFIPAGRILFGAGRPGQNMLNCFSLIPEDSVLSLSKLISNTYRISCGGGGIGFNFSKIRPRGDDIQNIKFSAPGAVSVIKLINSIGDHVKAGKNRRTALLAILDARHPDILEFLHVKLDKKELNNFNISVGITDEFLEACNEDRDWNFRFGNKNYYIYQIDRISVQGNDTINVVGIDAEDVIGRAKEHYKKHFEDKFENPIRIEFKAKTLWNLIWDNALEAGCPGIFNLSLVAKYTTVDYFEGPLECCNPCIPEYSKFLTRDGLRSLSELNVGDTIWTGKQWANLVKKWKTGTKSVFRYKTSSGYSIDCTEDHKLLTTDGKVEAKYANNIVVSNPDVVPLVKIDGWEKALLAGLVQGDGSKQKNGGKCAYLNIGKNDRDFYSDIMFYVEKIIPGNDSKCELWKLSVDFEELQLNYAPLPERSISDYWINGSTAAKQWFLRGLFSANGSVISEKRIALKTTCRNLANQVQLMLASLGIKSYITTNKPKEVIFSNGSYVCKESYDVNTSQTNSFMSSIGFLQTYKEPIVKESENIKKYSEIVESEYIGEMDVWDFTVGTSEHTAWVNGVIISNCSEANLPGDGGNCCLGQLNLSNFVENGEFDWRKLAQTIRVAVRFLDNVLTVNSYPIEGTKEVAHRSRRIGMGVMGFHYMLAKLGMRYGSEKSIEFTERLFTTIRNEAYLTSMYLGQEKGSFNAFNSEKYLREEFCKTLPARIRMLIKRNGMRNAILMAVAPTGTIGMLAEVSTSCEPIFAPMYLRRYREGNVLKEVVVVDPLFKEFVKQGKSLEELRNLFPGAYDVAPEEHMAIQATIQKFVDQSISKCIEVGSLIATDQGLVAVEDFSENQTPDSFSDPINQYTIDGYKVTKHYYAGMRSSTKIRLHTGATLVASEESHQVMTPYGWSKVSELEVGDLVLTKLKVSHGKGNLLFNWEDKFRTNSSKILAPAAMNPQIAKFFGMLCSDGHTVESTGCVGISHKNEDVGKEFTRLCVEIFGIEPNKQIDKRTGVEALYLTSRNLCRFVESIIGKGAYNKTVPKQVIGGNLEEKIEFLNGISLDGYNTDEGFCIYAGMSEKMAYQISEIARSTGLPQVYCGSKLVAYNGNTCYYVILSNQVAKLITPIEKHKNIQNYEKDYLVYVGSEAKNTKVNTSHIHYSAIRNMRQQNKDYCKKSLALSMGWKFEYLIGKVTNVESVGFRELYDIEVDHSHRYIVNSIVSHNTINLPSTAKAEDFAEMALAYAPYLKGMTVYRAASKENEPLSIIPLTQENLDLYLKPELEAEVTPAACSIEGGECGA